MYVWSRARRFLYYCLFGRYFFDFCTSFHGGKPHVCQQSTCVRRIKNVKLHHITMRSPKEQQNSTIDEKITVINKIPENNILLLYSKSNRLWIWYRNIRMCLMFKSVFFLRYFYCVNFVTHEGLKTNNNNSATALPRSAHPTEAFSSWTLLQSVPKTTDIVGHCIIFTVVIEKKVS